MNFIKEIFEGKQDQDWVHQRFIRYGKGEFCGPYISLKKSGAFLKISSSADYVNILGILIAKTSTGDLGVEGSILSREDIETYLKTIGLEIAKSSKRKGVFNYRVRGEVNPRALAELYERSKSSAFLLNLNSGSRVGLKVKKKLPKAGSKENRKFCAGTIDCNERVLDELCFDIDARDFKEIKVSHQYRIDELVIPEDCKDASLARILAKRKGSMKRMVEVDGTVHESEKDILV